jgi:hypothetical protein
MSSKTKEYTKYTMGVSRAIRNVQRILLRNDLDPFEFVVDIQAASVANDRERTYVLAISSAGGAVTVRKSGMPCGYIEDDWNSDNGIEFSRIVQSLVPDLLDRIRLSRKNKSNKPTTGAK